MKASSFQWYLNTQLLVFNHPTVPKKVSESTAGHWLHFLGFHPSETMKGVYFDRHECRDVVEYWRIFLRKLEVLEGTHAPPPTCGDEQAANGSTGTTQKHLVLIFHDESIFHSNEDRGRAWAEEGKQPIRPKGQGKGIMVSDFIIEYAGYLRLSDEEFRELIGTVHPSRKRHVFFGGMVLLIRDTGTMTISLNR